VLWSNAPILLGSTKSSFCVGVADTAAGGKRPLLDRLE
jgi:hypothetical protein